MKYLSKNPQSPLINSNLHYNKASQRLQLRQKLLAEQKGFCAYSERYIKHTDSRDIEHFDPTKKNTPADDYYNWYVTLTWMNAHKAKKLDNRFRPILDPFAPDLTERIIYQDGLFIAVNDNDVEAKNLINYLGFNKWELEEDRRKHIARIKSLKTLCGSNTTLFINKLKESKDNLSFITALEYEFKMSFIELID